MPMLQSDFDHIRKLVLERSGIVLDSGKQAMVEQKLGPVAKEKGYADASAFAKEVIPNAKSAEKSIIFNFFIISPSVNFRIYTRTYQ